MAQALSFGNRSRPLQELPTTPTMSTARICRTTAAIETYFESDNYPNPYPTNADCSYKIFRANRHICRVEIELVEFDVGNEIYDSAAATSNSLGLAPVPTTCPNDYLEIDQV
jgi:hypothetical protein